MIENHRFKENCLHDDLKSIYELIQSTESEESYQRIVNYFKFTETFSFESYEPIFSLVLNEILDRRHLHGLKCLFYIISCKKELLNPEFTMKLLHNIVNPILETHDESMYEYLFKILRIIGEISKDYFIVINEFISCDALINNVIYSLKGRALVDAISYFKLFIVWEPKISLDFANKICEIVKYTITLENHPDFLNLLSVSYSCLLPFARKNVCFVTLMKHHDIFYIMNDLLKMKSSSLKVYILELIKESYKQYIQFNTFDIKYIISLMNHNVQAIKNSSIHCIKEILNQYPNKINVLYENGLIENISYCIKDSYRTQIEILQLINIIINHDPSIITELMKFSINIISILFLVLENSQYSNFIMKLINKILMSIHDNDELVQAFIQEYEESNYFEIIDNLVANSNSQQFIESSNTFNNIISSYYRNT